MDVHDAAVHALVRHARPIILERYRADSCIASTRIAIAVLDYFGVRAEPQPVRAMAINKQTAAHFAAGEITTERPVETWSDVDGSWGVGIGYPPQDRHFDSGDKKAMGWVGHLVAVTERRALIDLSLDQAARPQRGMPLQPAAFNLPDHFPAAEAVYEVWDGCIVSYIAVTDDTWRSSPDWRKAERWRPLAGKIIRIAREEVAHAQGLSR